MFCNYILFGAMSELYWYYLRKAAIRSFQERIQEDSRLVYQVIATSAKLS